MDLRSENRNGEQASSTLTSRLEESFEKILTPFQYFIRDQTVTSAILAVSTLMALVLANSPWASAYYSFFEIEVGLHFGENSLSMDLHHWINDGLMALFFFVIGLEIKREILAGELSQPGRTLPVVMAALGGMALPALIYALFNWGTSSSHGWGIPMATDTAFVIGVLALLRKYIPAGLVAFITALAIIDDIGAIIVIALFYTEEINLASIGNAAIILFVMVLVNILGLRSPTPYLLLGGLLWLSMLESGIHATIAGILAAMAVPARPRLSPTWFVRRTKMLLRSFERNEMSKTADNTILADGDQHAIVEKIHTVANKASTPLQRWESLLGQPVALLVLPVFVFANAGIPLDISVFPQLVTPLSIGVIAGLVLGKGLGISLVTFAVLKFGIGSMPGNVRMYHVIGVGLLAGIGFTMSIFVANLGFSSNQESLNAAKTAVLSSSLIAGISGYVWLRWFGSKLQT